MNVSQRMYASSSELPNSKKSVIGLDIRALDPSFKDHAHRGIGRYVRELHRFMQHCQSDLVKVEEVNFGRIRDSESRGIHIMESLIEKSPLGKTTLRQQLLFPLTLGGLKAHGKSISTLHFPAHMDAPSWGLSGYVLTVLDLIPLVCADLYKAQNLGPRYHFARWLEKRAILNARLILAISENTAHDLNRVMGVPYERIMVTPLGVHSKLIKLEERTANPAEKAEVLRKLGVGGVEGTRPLLLYVGGIDPRKNYSLLVKLMAELREISKETGEFSMPLLLMAGNIATDKEYPKLLGEIRALQLEDTIKLLGYVEDSALNELYRISNIFVFPSLYEGFGLPPLEAMSAGLPVVSSNTSAMPEVIGDAAVLANPTSVEEFTEGVRSLLISSERAREFAERGIQRAKLFTWEKTGEKTLKAYERLVNH